MVNIGVSLFFAEISGSAVADVAALGSVPQMKKGLLGSTCCCCDIIVGISCDYHPAVDPDDSVCDIGRYLGRTTFVAGIIPGLLGAFGLMGMAYFRESTTCLQRSIRIPSALDTLIDALPAFTLPVIILGGSSVVSLLLLRPQDLLLLLL